MFLPLLAFDCSHVLHPNFSRLSMSFRCYALSLTTNQRHPKTSHLSFLVSSHHWLHVEYIFSHSLSCSSLTTCHLFSICSSHLSGYSYRGPLYLQYTACPPLRLFRNAGMKILGSRACNPIYVPSRFHFPTMSPPWALTSLARLRPGVPTWTLWRQTYASKTSTLPRGYSTVSPEANSESNSPVLTDPERPDLFYHLLEPPSAVSATNHVFGLSFLDALKTKDGAQSPRIIGYLPASEGGHAIEAGLNDFKENRKSATDLGGRPPLILSRGSWVQGDPA